jgi:hypothetical protein
LIRRTLRSRTRPTPRRECQPTILHDDRIPSSPSERKRDPIRLFWNCNQHLYFQPHQVLSTPFQLQHKQSRFYPSHDDATAGVANNGLKIRINSIAPGVFPSEMTAGESDDKQKSHTPMENYERLPTKRLRMIRI